MKTILGIAIACSTILSCTSPFGSSSGGSAGTSGLSDLRIETKSDICDDFVGSRQTDEICLFTVTLVPVGANSTGTITLEPVPLQSDGPVVRNSIQVQRNKEYDGTMEVGWGLATDDQIRRKLYTTKNGKQRIIATGSTVNVTFALVDPTLDNTVPNNPNGGINPQPSPTPPSNSNGGPRPQLGNLDVTLQSQSETKKLSELFTEFALVDISASWCGPCRSFAQGPSLSPGSQLMQTFKGGKCAFVTILADANDSQSAFQSWISSVPAYAASHTYKVQGMSDPQIRSTFGNVSSYPSFRLIDKSGKISNASPDAIPSNVAAACQ